MTALIMAVVLSSVCSDCEYTQAQIDQYEQQLADVREDLATVESMLAVVNIRFASLNRILASLLEVPEAERDALWWAQFLDFVTQRNNLYDAREAYQSEIDGLNYTIADLEGLIAELHRVIDECDH